MLLIKKGLPATAEAAGQYMESWKGLLDTDGKSEPHELQRRLFDHMYGNLDVLDNKTNSLIQLAGILVAAFSFLLQLPAWRWDADTRSLFVFGVSYAAMAVFLCLRVIWVHWSSREDLEQEVEHLRSLIRIRTARTIEFRRAWTFCALSLFALVVLLLREEIPIGSSLIAPVIPVLAVAHLLLIYVYDSTVIALRRWRRSKAKPVGRVPTTSEDYPPG